MTYIRTPQPITMSDEELAAAGLVAAEGYYNWLVRSGHVKGGVYLRVGTLEGYEFRQFGECALGLDAIEFAFNTNPDAGALLRVAAMMKSTDAHYCTYGSPPGTAHQVTSGVFYVARVEVGQKWRTRVFVGAASGLLAPFCRAITEVTLATMGALWCARARVDYREPQG